MDKISHEPLASRVCREDSSLPLSSGVTTLLNNINEYLPPNDAEVKELGLHADAPETLIPQVIASDHVGPMLVLVALFIWLCMIAKNINAVCPLMSALHTLSLSKYQGHDGRQKHTVVHFGRSRLILACCTVFLQLCILSLLALCGSLYIIYTVSLQDLLLNCSALCIVVDLDELIFEAFAPSRTRALLTHLKPVPRTIFGRSVE